MLVCLLAMLSPSYGQDINGRILKIKNSQIQYYIRSISQISTGVSYSNNLIFSISFCNAVAATQTEQWELVVRTEEGQFDGSYTSDFLPMSIIQISSNMKNGSYVLNNEALYDNLVVAEGDLPVAIGDCVTDTIYISTSVQSLIGYEDDTYLGTLNFELRSK